MTSTWPRTDNTPTEIALMDAISQAGKKLAAAEARIVERDAYIVDQRRWNEELIAKLEARIAEWQCPECEGCQTANEGEMLVPCPECAGTGLALGKRIAKLEAELEAIRQAGEASKE